MVCKIDKKSPANKQGIKKESARKLKAQMYGATRTKAETADTEPNTFYMSIICICGYKVNRFSVACEIELCAALHGYTVIKVAREIKSIRRPSPYNHINLWQRARICYRAGNIFFAAAIK